MRGLTPFLLFPAIAGAHVLENAMLRVEVAEQTGSIARILDKRDGTEYVTEPGRARLFSLRVPDSVSYSRNIASWQQQSPEITRTANRIELHYAALKPDEDQYQFGAGLMHVSEPVLPIDVHVVLELEGDHIEARMSIANASHLTVTGVIFPYVGGLAGEAQGSAAQVVLPSAAQRIFGHTHGALSGQRAIRYPGVLASSWLNYELGSHSLGIEMRTGLETQDAYFSLNSGPFRPGSAYRGRYEFPFVAWIQYPHIATNQKWESPPAILHVHGSDWHALAGEHREWYRAERSPRITTAWAGDIGFATYTLKRDDNTINWSYRQLPDLAATATAAGLRRLVIDGWRQQEGPGNPAPFGELADKRLGGARELKRAIEALHAKGTELLFTFHPTLMNVLQDKEPAQLAFWPVKTRRQGNQMPVDLLFFTHDAPDTFTGPTYRLEIDPASGATGFLLQEARRLKDEYGFRNLLLKGVGQRSFLSYNRHHGVLPQNVYTQGYARLLGGLHETFAQGLLVNEGFNDLVNSYGDGAYTWNQSADAAVLAYSQPWGSYSNDVEALDYAAVNTAFAHKMLANLVVDGGSGSVETYPEFAAHLKSLQALEASAQPYYGDAEFRDRDGLLKVANDAGALTTVFVNRSKAATGIVLTNLNSKAATVRFELPRNFAMAEARLLPPSAKSLDLAQPIALELAPHQIRILTIDASITR